MRRSAIGLQLALLVAGGVASGYLWRAALEAGSTVRYVSVAEPYRPAALVRPLVRWTIVVERPRGAARRTAQKRLVVHSTRSRAAAVAQLASRTVSSSSAAASSPGATSPGSSPPHPGSRPTHRVSPPPPSAAPPPSSPPGHSPPPPAPPPPAPLPPPAPPPSPPPPPPTVVTPPPVVPTASPPPQRPGWGYGDRNHSHTGPPGQTGHGHGKK